MINTSLEYALVVFPGNKFSGDIVPELMDLADRGVVRFVDIIFIQKEKDGTLHFVELNDVGEDLYRLFVPIGKHVSSLFTEDDLLWAASQLPEESSAALFLWENWAENIRKAIKASGGKLAQGGLIPADVVAQFEIE